jgi:Pyruvate/2-oxoacid:ferredoxin oxidoreductase gamma subunit
MFEVRFHGRGGQGTVTAQCPCGAIEMVPEQI